MGPRDDDKLERLKDTVAQTKALYADAKESLDKSREIRADLGNTHPDGTLRMAQHIYNHALLNYRQALLEYNRFILGRHKP